jgi:hypothetical protein
MKFQKMIRVQLMLVGLGAGLLMAKPVFAQQDTDPTLFEATNVASQPDQMGFNVPPTTGATIATPAVSTVQASVQQADAAVLTAPDVNTILAIMTGLGAIVLLGITEVLRGSRRRTWKAEASDRLPSGAIAN